MIRHVLLEAKHELVVFLTIALLIETFIDDRADMLLCGTFAIVIALAERRLFEVCDFEVTGAEPPIWRNVCGLYATPGGGLAPQLRLFTFSRAHLLAVPRRSAP